MITLEKLMVGEDLYFAFFICQALVHGDNNGLEGVWRYQIIENGFKTLELPFVFTEKTGFDHFLGIFFQMLFE